MEKAIEKKKKEAPAATGNNEVKEKLGDTILLTCQTTKPSSSRKQTEVAKLVKNTADVYRVMIDYILNINHVYTYRTVSKST